MILIQAQEPSPLQTEKTLSLIELIQNGGLGGQLIIGLLFILLLMVVYIELCGVLMPYVILLLGIFV